MSCDYLVRAIEPLPAVDGRPCVFPAPAAHLGSLLEHFPLYVRPRLAHVILHEGRMAGGAAMGQASVAGRERVVATWPWEAAYVHGLRSDGLTPWEQTLLCQLEWTAAGRGDDLLFLAPLRLFTGQIATVLETGGRIVRDSAVAGLRLPAAWVGAELPVGNALALLRARREAARLIARLSLRGGGSGARRAA